MAFPIKSDPEKQYSPLCPPIPSEQSFNKPSSHPIQQLEQVIIKAEDADPPGRARSLLRPIQETIKVQEQHYEDCLKEKDAQVLALKLELSKAKLSTEEMDENLLVLRGELQDAEREIRSVKSQAREDKAKTLQLESEKLCWAEGNHRRVEELEAARADLQLEIAFLGNTTKEKKKELFDLRVTDITQRGEIHFLKKDIETLRKNIQLKTATTDWLVHNGPSLQQDFHKMRDKIAELKSKGAKMAKLMAKSAREWESDVAGLGNSGMDADITVLLEEKGSSNAGKPNQDIAGAVVLSKWLMGQVHTLESIMMERLSFQSIEEIRYRCSKCISQRILRLQDIYQNTTFLRENYHIHSVCLLPIDDAVFTLSTLPFISSREPAELPDPSNNPLEATFHITMAQTPDTTNIPINLANTVISISSSPSLTSNINEDDAQVHPELELAIAHASDPLPPLAPPLVKSVLENLSTDLSKIIRSKDEIIEHLFNSYEITRRNALKAENLHLQEKARLLQRAGYDNAKSTARILELHLRVKDLEEEKERLASTCDSETFQLKKDIIDLRAWKSEAESVVEGLHKEIRETRSGLEKQLAAKDILLEQAQSRSCENAKGLETRDNKVKELTNEVTELNRESNELLRDVRDLKTQLRGYKRKWEEYKEAIDECLWVDEHQSKNAPTV
ncbi:hypothetical protein BKA64DRAFT_778843 [Cadophora sp. MPI-SDFR-AT-0126]|nr:hypothetical protein BKA64DRAFT_778843 [Leotiomycetes sp. MPI-SDFR-AT-0126]